MISGSSGSATKHVIGMYDEVNSFVSFVKDAAEGGSSREMAFVLVGEPGNGKTFFVDYLCTLYRQFLASRGKPKIHVQFQEPGQTRRLRQDKDHPVADLRRPDDPGHESARIPGGEQRVSRRLGRFLGPADRQALPQLPASWRVQRLYPQRHQELLPGRPGKAFELLRGRSRTS